jgi:hypothetical protein
MHHWIRRFKPAACMLGQTPGSVTLLILKLN